MSAARSRLGRAGRVIALVLVQAAVVVGAFQLGAHRSPYTVHVGQAYYGTDVFTVSAGGWSYGGSLPESWHDDAGWHQGGRPSCMTGVAGTVTGLRFASIDRLSRGLGTRPVAWLDCSGATRVTS